MAVSQSLTLTQVSQDIAGNTSAVRILWQSTQTNDSHNDNTRTAYYYVSVNGGTNTEYTVTYTLPLRQTKTILDTTITVPHLADGTGSVSVSTWMDTRISAGVVELTKTLYLTQIPRESTVGATDAYIGSNTAITVNKKYSGYQHSIYLNFGAEAFYLREDGGTSGSEVIFSRENISFPIPARFYSQIPESRSGVCTLTVRTYSGSTAIGEPKTGTFSVMTREADCAPTVSGTVTDGNSVTAALTGNPASLIRYASTAVCRITAEPRCYAQITEKKVNGNAVEYEISFPNMEASGFTFTAVDGRGYSASVTVNPTTVVPYIPLTCKVTAGRTDPTSGNATLSIDGNYFDGSFGAEENTLTVCYRIGDGEDVTVTPAVSEGRYSVKVPLTGLDYTMEHAIQVTVQDRIRTIPQTATVGKGIPVFDWGENDFQFHVPVLIPRFQEGTGSQGVCLDANECKAPGVYLLVDESANCPIQNGMLAVFAYNSQVLLQFAVDWSGEIRRLRVIWWGTQYNWLTV